jgi:hypothetical protein
MEDTNKKYMTKLFCCIICVSTKCRGCIKNVKIYKNTLLLVYFPALYLPFDSETPNKRLLKPAAICLHLRQATATP